MASRASASRSGRPPAPPGDPGVKPTGQRLDQCVEPGGRFARACAELVDERGFSVPYVELSDAAERAARERKAASKTRYTCPGCAANAWAKPGTWLACGACNLPMEVQPQ